MKKCENCNAEGGQMKAGKTVLVSRRYKCKKFGKVHTLKPKGIGHSEETKEMVIKLLRGGK